LLGLIDGLVGKRQENFAARDGLGDCDLIFHCFFTREMFQRFVSHVQATETKKFCGNETKQNSVSQFHYHFVTVKG